MFDFPFHLGDTTHYYWAVLLHCCATLCHIVPWYALLRVEMIRVALHVRWSRDQVDAGRMGYLAVTDRLPAGFEAVNTDLWTVARVPELSKAHPFYRQLQWSSNVASHLEMRDDRVDLYFDRVHGDSVVATYLVRATTPGEFQAAAPMAELMYEADSTGYGTSKKVVIK